MVERTNSKFTTAPIHPSLGGYGIGAFGLYGLRVHGFGVEG